MWSYSYFLSWTLRLTLFLFIYKYIHYTYIFLPYPHSLFLFRSNSLLCATLVGCRGLHSTFQNQRGVIFYLSSLGAARIRAPYLGSRIWTLQLRASDLQGVTHRCRNNLEITCNSKDSKSLQWVCMSDVSCPLMCDPSQHPKQTASLVLSGLWLLLLRLSWLWFFPSRCLWAAQYSCNKFLSCLC